MNLVILPQFLSLVTSGAGLFLTLPNELNGLFSLLNQPTNQLFNLPFLDSRLCFQLNELNGLVTHYCSWISGYPRIKYGAGPVKYKAERGFTGQASSFRRMPESSVMVVLCCSSHATIHRISQANVVLH